MGGFDPYVADNPDGGGTPTPETPDETPPEPPSGTPRPQSSRPVVRVPPLDPNLGLPFIDGAFDEGIWNQAVFTDPGNLDNQNLQVDRLLLDNGAEAADGEVPYTWFAMHDFTFLYLFVQVRARPWLFHGGQGTG